MSRRMLARRSRRPRDLIARRLVSDPHLVLAAGAVGVVAAEYLFRTRGNPYGLNTEKPAWLLFQLAIGPSGWSLRPLLSAWLAAVLALWPLSTYWWEFRLDLGPGGPLALGLAPALHRRWEWAGLALGLGTAVKWSPSLAFGAL